MNIRIDAQQIRLRLDPPDVDMLAGSLAVTMACALNPPGLCVALLSDASISATQMRWYAQRGLLEITLAPHDLKHLLDPAQESLDCPLPGPVSLLIEKDRRTFTRKIRSQ